MRRAVVTASATAAGVVLLLSLKPHDPSHTAAISSSGGASDTSTQPARDTGDASGSTPSSAPSASSGGSRTVTGSAINTRYGPVQVKVTLDGSSRITQVDVIQYPNRDRRDQEINSYAIPELNKEAIAAQSAQIDVISGATYTSDGYTRSLQSALDRAAK